MTHNWPPGRAFWTEEFPAQTSSRTAPYLFKGIIPASAASAEHVLDGFAAIRGAHAAQTDIKAKARVYVGEDRRDDLLPGVLGAAPWVPGDFVGWMQDLAGAERFSVVLNNLETAAPPLAAGLGDFLASLFDGWGVPLGGAEQVAFAGNYAGTAFGVHEGYEDAFLVHLGPGTKNFYTWPSDQYEKLTGGTDPLYGNYRWLLQHGEHFVLEPGDALFLPRRIFHVGTQDDFSISVAVPLYTYPDAGILRQSVLPELVDAVLAASGPDDELGEPSPMASHSEGSEPVARRLTAMAQTALARAIAQAQAAVEQHAEARWQTVLSNGGWEVVEGDLARVQAIAAFDPRQVQPGAAVRLIAPYRLRGSTPGLYLRGFHVPLDAAALGPDLLAALAVGDAVTLPQDQDTLAAIRALGATGGLHLTPRPAHLEDTPA